MPIRFLIVIIFISTLNMCCSVRPNYISVDAGLQSYVTSFVTEYQNRVNSNYKLQALDVHFVDVMPSSMAPGVVGLCSTSPTDVPHISVLASYWQNIPEATREELMYHELGHCVLGLDHRTAVDSNNVPLSIMYPYVLMSNVYNSSTKQPYLVELFTNSHAYTLKSYRNLPVDCETREEDLVE